MTPKQTVIFEHRDAMGPDLGDNSVLVRKAAFAPNRYYAYWMGGEIERRDTYIVEKGEATLESMHQFDNGKWRHIQ